MRLLAIDPGNKQSAWLILGEGGPLTWEIIDNETLRSCSFHADHLAIEMVASFGMPVGREVFDTVLWTGRFIETLGLPHTLVYRQQVKLHHCHSNRANDATIRQALIDRYGGKEEAIGKKKNPGPLYGISKDCWSALAIATYWWDVERPKLEKEKRNGV